MKRNRILIICGPTATGKTSLGVELAKQFNGEVISADSRQVYTGMDIGTGKGLEPSMQYVAASIQGQNIGVYVKDGIKIWGYDLVEPTEAFSVAEYQQLMMPVIKDIINRDKLPIIVGGTGFYIEALVNPPDTLGVQADPQLRQELEKLTVFQLQDKLEETDSKKLLSMNNSDKNNPRRLIRAIEVATFRSHESGVKSQEKSENNIFWIGLTGDKQALLERVKQNVKSRATDQFTTEIQQLESKGFDWSSPAASSTGYKEWNQYLEGNMDKEEVISQWVLQEHQYQKRQLTWFKKNPAIHWFNLLEDKLVQLVADQVIAW